MCTACREELAVCLLSVIELMLPHHRSFDKTNTEPVPSTAQSTASSAAHLSFVFLFIIFCWMHCYVFRGHLHYSLLTESFDACRQQINSAALLCISQQHKSDKILYCLLLNNPRVGIVYASRTPRPTDSSSLAMRYRNSCYAHNILPSLTAEYQ